MRVVVIDDDGKFHQIRAGVAIIADETMDMPVAVARQIHDEIQFVTVATPDDLVTTLRQVVPAKLLTELFQMPKQVFELQEGQDKIRKVN